jgi:hypothetical protein
MVLVTVKSEVLLMMLLLLPPPPPFSERGTK